MKLTLPSGITGFYNDANRWIATGSQMGRRNILPDDRNAPAKLHLVRLKFVDGAYDRWGTYWGGPANLYIAFTAHFLSPNYSAEVLHNDTQIFIRAESRDEAKAKVREQLPNARFYR